VGKSVVRPVRNNDYENVIAPLQKSLLIPETIRALRPAGNDNTKKAVRELEEKLET